MTTIFTDHRPDRDHQHHARHPGDPAAHPLRHGPRGRRPGRLRQDPPDPPQPVGRAALQRLVVVAALLVTGTLVTEAGGGIDLVDRLALVTVVFLLAIYALVIVACLKLRGQDEDERAFRANTPLLIVGLVGNLAILYFAIYDDPHSLIWCAGLLAVGRGAVPRRVALRQQGHRVAGPPTSTARRSDMHVIVATDGSPPVAGRRQAPQVLRRSHQDHRDLGRRGDPAAGLGRLRRRPVRGARPRGRTGRSARPRESAVDDDRRGLRRLGPEGQQADPQRLGRQRDHQGRQAVRRRAGRGRGGRARAQRRVLVGSTAQRVQHYAPCPVLVVRPAPKPKKPPVLIVRPAH